MSSNGRVPAVTAVLLVSVLLGWGCLTWRGVAHSQNTTKTPDGQASVPLRPLSRGWQQRIRSSADSPRLARQVIFDSIYANRTLEVGLAYQSIYQQKPNSQIRIANYAHAMTVAEVFCQQHGDVLVIPYSHAIKTLKAIVVPEMELPPTEQAKAALNKTKVADAWLAWGIYSIRYTMDYKSADAIYRHALKLDPSLQEANYWRADMTIAPFDEAYFKAHKIEALQQLSEAERSEPKLRPLVVDCRAYLALGSWDYKAAIPYLQEYLRLWPTSPRAGITAKLIQQLKAAKQPRLPVDAK